MNYYNDSKINEIVEKSKNCLSESSKSHLFVLYGYIKTGKMTLVNHIVKEVMKRDSYIINVANPDFIEKFNECKNHKEEVIIFTNLEELVTDPEKLRSDQKYPYPQNVYELLINKDFDVIIVFDGQKEDWKFRNKDIKYIIDNDEQVARMPAWLERESLYDMILESDDENYCTNQSDNFKNQVKQELNSLIDVRKKDNLKLYRSLTYRDLQKIVAKSKLLIYEETQDNPHEPVNAKTLADSLWNMIEQYISSNKKDKFDKCKYADSRDIKGICSIIKEKEKIEKDYSTTKTSLDETKTLLRSIDNYIDNVFVPIKFVLFLIFIVGLTLLIVYFQSNPWVAAIFLIIGLSSIISILVKKLIKYIIYGKKNYDDLERLTNK